MPQPIERVRVSTYSRAPSLIEKDYFHSLIAAFATRRAQLKLTQEELDERLGVSSGQVAKWESFLRLPGAFMLMCWGNALGLQICTISNEH